jgi:hypothetical protein
MYLSTQVSFDYILVYKNDFSGWSSILPLEAKLGPMGAVGPWGPSVRLSIQQNVFAAEGK